jgi:hypothetical protein
MDADTSCEGANGDDFPTTSNMCYCINSVDRCTEELFWHHRTSFFLSFFYTFFSVPTNALGVPLRGTIYTLATFKFDSSLIPALR